MIVVNHLGLAPLSVVSPWSVWEEWGAPRRSVIRRPSHHLERTEASTGSQSEERCVGYLRVQRLRTKCSQRATDQTKVLMEMAIGDSTRGRIVPSVPYSLVR